MTFANLSKLVVGLEQKYGKLPPVAVMQGGRAGSDVIDAAVSALRAGKASAMEVDLLARHLDVVQGYGDQTLVALEKAAVRHPPRPASLFRGVTQAKVTIPVRGRFVAIARAQAGLDPAEEALLAWMEGDGKAGQFVAKVSPRSLATWMDERGALGPWLMPVVEAWFTEVTERDLDALTLDTVWDWHYHGAFNGILARARRRDGIHSLQRVGTRVLSVANRVFADRMDRYKAVRNPIHEEWRAIDPAVIRNLRGADVGLSQNMLDALDVTESDLSVAEFLSDLSGLEGVSGERMSFWRYEFPRLKQYGVRMCYTSSGVGREGRLLIALPDGTIAVEFTEGGSLRFFGAQYPGFDVKEVERAATSTAWRTTDFKSNFARPSHMRVDHHPSWQQKAQQRLYAHLRGGAR